VVEDWNGVQEMMSSEEDTGTGNNIWLDCPVQGTGGSLIGIGTLLQRFGIFSIRVIGWEIGGRAPGTISTCNGPTALHLTRCLIATSTD
jgi:hypothetical protein